MTGSHLSTLAAALDEELPAAAALRHRVHARPCLSGAEAATRDLVLAALPAGSTTKVADTGAVVRIGGPGPAIAVRAELDALAVQEKTGAPWTSEHPGLMHACGHDVHLAALTALARAIGQKGGPAPLLAVLQPREETYPSGAQDVVEDGILDRERCRAVIGAHVQPLLPAGTVACTPGGVNASSDEFRVTVHGRSGHAAYPHLTRDPVVTLAHIVVALQSLVSRGTDPMSHVVLSISTLAAGTAANVIPGTAEARGTLRALGNRERETLHARLAEVAGLVAQAHGCTAQVDITRGEPVLDNDPALTAATRPLLGPLGLRVGDDLRSAGSDDFSFFCAQLPSLMLFVGTHGGTEQLHSPTFLPPDDRIRDVAHALLAGYLAAAELHT
ncbi:M20 metallopeptidase family protein [Streptomyces auratus]|uniref:Amidohydrolase n=1 Tax=Streptomyces auratus AGR0001 TaxID=1160718 RepID=J1RL54_9ACTN|nr:M20 family metallopeptidase [Streptomyces auratus]QTZ92014.1 amidohydrolase [Streptomyces auratus AGR0001]